MIDIPGLLLKQLDREKIVQSLFQQARRVAEQNQAQGARAKIKTMGAESPRMLKERSRTTRVLERLEIDEAM